ncbi:MAG TPA: VanZ family protein [Thermomicrobiales bacterium]|nr:VanZ family protein [Thermomicrobiales bacterium]
MIATLTSIATSRSGRILPPLAWIALSFYLSHQPTLPYPEGLDAKIISTMGHVGVFGVLSVLIWWALGLRSDGVGIPPGGRPVPSGGLSLAFGRREWLAIALTVAYGFIDEWHQSFVPGRTPDWRDIVADTIGAVLAMLVVRWIAAQVERRQERAG